MKIVTVVGARPQFIKAAVLSRALRALPSVKEVLVHTGQHYDVEMSDCFFDELDISVPDYNLAIVCNSHGMQTGRMLEGVEGVLQSERPDCVLVYGDTNSTLAGALAAAKLSIPIAHVEAGLRSFNRKQPEEINRVLTDHASLMLFAPTTQAVDNLRREGIEWNVYLVGDVMYDAALFYASRAEQRSRILERLGLKAKNYVLATIHRPENTDHTEHLSVLMRALANVSREITVVLPLHPRTRKILQEKSMLEGYPTTLQVIEPVGYLDMLMLEKRARLVATDSGGVQKEAFFYSVPCVTLRERTEWVELVQMGWNRLAPPSSVETVTTVLLGALGATPPPALSPYGAGTAAEHIARVVTEGVSWPIETEIASTISLPAA